MEGQTEEPEQTWRARSEQAAIEKDVKKLIQLGKEKVDRLLTETENRQKLPAFNVAFSHARTPNPLHEGRR